MVHDRKSCTSLKREETLSLKFVRGLGPIQILKIAVRAPVAPNVLSLSLPPVWRPQKPHPGGIGQAPEYRSENEDTGFYENAWNTNLHLTDNNGSYSSKASIF